MYTGQFPKILFVSGNDFRVGWLGPFVKGIAEIGRLGSDKGLELLALVEVGQGGYFPYEIVEIPLAFVCDLFVDDADGLVGDGGYEAARVAFDHDSPHFMKLVESSEDIYFAFWIFAHNMVDDILHE